MVKKVFSSLLLSLLFQASYSQDARTSWVDSIFNRLNRNEKVAQLFMIPLSSYVQGDERDELTKLVKSYGPGSVYVTRGGPVSHSLLLNQLQKVSETPLMAGVAAEWEIGRAHV